MAGPALAAPSRALAEVLQCKTIMRADVQAQRRWLNRALQRVRNCPPVRRVRRRGEAYGHPVAAGGGDRPEEVTNRKWPVPPNGLLPSIRRLLALAILFAAPWAHAVEPKIFASPEAAASAFGDAVMTSNTPALRAILGNDAGKYIPPVSAEGY